MSTSFKECHKKKASKSNTHFYCMFHMILSSFHLISCLFCSISDGKSCFSVRESIWTREWHAENPFAGRNTQHLSQKTNFVSVINIWNKTEFLKRQMRLSQNSRVVLKRFCCGVISSTSAMLLASCGCHSDFYCNAAIDEPQ